MKNLILLILLMSCTLIGYGQKNLGLGNSLAEIQERFPESKFDIKESKDNLGGVIFTVIFPKGDVAYIFDEQDICVFCTVMPKTQAYMNSLIADYNKDLVIVSDTKWKKYSNGHVAEIELVHVNNKGYLFVWKRASTNN